jgi:imidazolonepropionase-like amidohydrolase
MPKHLVALIILLGVATAEGGTRLPLARQALPTYEFINGLWFTGESFEALTMYSVDGRFTSSRPRGVDHTLDLEGAYLVPPFADAHNHVVGNPTLGPQMIPRFLEDGVFYVKCPDAGPRSFGLVRHRYNGPTTIDVTSAVSVTVSNGHPIALRERLIDDGMAASFVTRESFAENGPFAIDSLSDLENKWPLIVRFRPDFIKAFLWRSGQFEERQANPATRGRRGLDPALLPAIVSKAHAHGLRVSTHVVTNADFHNSVVAGVDELAHLPAAGPGVVDAEDARRAAQQGIIVVTTARWWPEANRENRPEAAAAVERNYRLTIPALLQAGVQLAVGSDNVRDTSVEEVDYLRTLGVIDNLTLLKMWSENAPHTIFPDRRIGRLDEGYEASFLALSGNPLDDFENTRRIRLRFKQGVLLQP